MSDGVDMAADNGVIGVSVTPVSGGVAVTGPITRAIGRSVTVRGVAETGPITGAIRRGVAASGCS